MTTEGLHRPVLVREVLDLLQPRPGGVYVDGTVGDGGHARAILDASRPDGRLVGLDRDPLALVRAAETLAPDAERVHLAHASYREVSQVLASLGHQGADGILLDLGVSTLQLTDGERGFSFRAHGPIDMRMNPTEIRTAKDLLEELSTEELANVLWELGEERHSRRIARAIHRALEAGELETTADLADVVLHAVPPGARHGRIHPATRTFQALRIALNRELDHLQEFLAGFELALRPAGSLAILTYHSLEDRLVKHTFRAAAARGGVDDLTRRPLRPSDEETDTNPRARSAKLRAVRRLA